MKSYKFITMVSFIYKEYTDMVKNYNARAAVHRYAENVHKEKILIKKHLQSFTTY